MSRVGVLALGEIRESFRSRWFLAVTVVFAALALVVSYLNFAGASQLGFAGFHRTVASLLNLVLVFVPLMSLLVAALSLSGEREEGTLAYILSQPVSRAAVYFAKFAGQSLSLALSVVLGLGLAGVVIALRAGGAELRAYGVFAAAAVLLSFACLGTGLLVGALARDRLRAIAAVLLLWLFFTFAVDFGMIALAVRGGASPETLFWVSLANPVQQAKVLSLLELTQRLEVLGPSGMYAAKTFGVQGASALMGAFLVGWGILAGSAGYVIFRRANL